MEDMESDPGLNASLPLAAIQRKVLHVKIGTLTLVVLLVVVCIAQKKPSQRRAGFQWGAGEPQRLDTTLADYKGIRAEDRSALVRILTPNV